RDRTVLGIPHLRERRQLLEYRRQRERWHRERLAAGVLDKRDRGSNRSGEDQRLAAEHRCGRRFLLLPCGRHGPNGQHDFLQREEQALLGVLQVRDRTTLGIPDVRERWHLLQYRDQREQWQLERFAAGVLDRRDLHHRFRSAADSPFAGFRGAGSPLHGRGLGAEL